MRYSVEFSLDATLDLRAILRFLIKNHVQFGASFSDAKARAGERVIGIEAAIELLAAQPHQGTLLPNLMPGLRSVTKKRAIFYFTLDDDQRVVRVLAVFFGGQDHQRAMLRRVMSGK